MREARLAPVTFDRDGGHAPGGVEEALVARVGGRRVRPEDDHRPEMGGAAAAGVHDGLAPPAVEAVFDERGDGLAGSRGADLEPGHGVWDAGTARRHGEPVERGDAGCGHVRRRDHPEEQRVGFDDRQRGSSLRHPGVDQPGDSVERDVERRPPSDRLEDPGLLRGDGLGAASIGDVARVAEHPTDPGIVGEQHRHRPEPAPRPVVVADPMLDRCGDAGPEQLLGELAGHVVDLVGVQHVNGDRPDEIRGVVPEGALVRWAREHEAAFVVVDRDQVVGVLHQGPEPALGEALRRFGLHQLRDVDDRPDVTGEGPGGVVAGHADVDDPVERAVGDPDPVVHLVGLAPVHQLDHTVAVVGVEPGFPAVTELRSLTPAGEVVPTPVEEHDPTIGVGHPDHDGRARRPHGGRGRGQPGRGRPGW